MSSLKQIEANRRNALHSTGPTTPEGRERSRRNALRHGLTAETVVAALEDSEDYQAFEAAVISDHDAESAVERELVLRLASVLWRLRRATGIETALINFVAEDSHSHKRGFAPETLAKRADPSSLQPVPESESGSSQVNFDSNAALADSFLRLAALPSCPLDRLSRYEYTLWRQARQLVLTLDSLRHRKLEGRRPAFPFSFRRPGSGSFPEGFR